MWGDWVDKAKGLAADLDKQLNDSVGADPSSTAASTPPLATPIAIPESSALAADDLGQEDDDAWNDDFAFDDDEPGISSTASKPIPVETTSLPPSPPPEPVVPAPSPPKPAQNFMAPLQVVDDHEPPTEDGWDQEDNLEVTESEVVQDVSGPIKAVAPVKAPEPDTPDPVSQAPATPELVVPTPPSPRETDMAAEESPIQDTNSQEAPPSPQTTSSPRVLQDPPSPSHVAAASLAVASNMWTSIASKASTAKPLSQIRSAAKNIASHEEDFAAATHGLTSFLTSAATKALPIKKEVEVSKDGDIGDDGDGWDGDELDVTEEPPEEESIPPLAVTPPALQEEPVEVEETLAPVTSTLPEPLSSTPAPAPTTVSASPLPAAPVPTAGQPSVVKSPQPTIVPSPSPQSQPTVTSPKPVIETPLFIPSLEPKSESPTPAAQSISAPSPVNIEDDPRFQDLKKQLTLREDQLTNKSEQLAQLQGMWEQQEADMQQKLIDTKEEAKKRITRAKERCQAAEAKLQAMQSSGADSSAQQDSVIAALREEGQKLAVKQSEMEKAVRSAKGQSRVLQEQLEDETDAKNKALEQVAKLQAELKATKDSLSSARKGESQAGKLESDLLAARSDADLKTAQILSLQQQMKELTAENKVLLADMERSRKSASQEAQQEKKALRREHNDVISDLEQKLRTTEREAGVREDALRHEVQELRKRWQDAVRRADALSMDVQSSTAPLMRQLESMERQNRARASAWAELETRLRSELEETVIQNESLSKDRTEFKTKYTRLERSVKERDTELTESKRTLEDQTAKMTKLEAQLEELEAEAEKRQVEYSEVERLANEGVMRVRSEMTQTVVDSEERYRGQIDKLEGDLRVEREKRSQLEQQVENMLENAGMIVAPRATEAVRIEAKPKKLVKAEGQAEILAGALGFDSDEDSDGDSWGDDGGAIGKTMERGDSDLVHASAGVQGAGSMNSFAALEQLTSRLKVSKVELEALRKNLRESEKTRESLVEELAESRTAKEKLPLFEAKVKELTQDNREKEFEIRGLQDDIAEVRELYRTQLNVLLEEKASLATTASAQPMNGNPRPAAPSEPDTLKPQIVEEAVEPPAVSHDPPVQRIPLVEPAKKD